MTQHLLSLEDRYGAHNYHPLDVVVERAEGTWMYGTDGRAYLDFLAAYSAVNQGHCHPRILRALTEQAAKVTLTSRAFRNMELPCLLEELCTLTGFEMALMMNSGVEAVETAIKAARKWGKEIKGIADGQQEIVVCENNFHGRTIAVVGFSSEEQYRDGFGPFAPGFKRIPFGDAEALERAITPNTCAFLVEPIQGEACVLVPPVGFLKQASEICRRNNVLLVTDEIQSGLGRTGRMFAFEHEGVRPDVCIIGKALSGGFYPVSAVLSRREVLGVFRPGDHGSTFGGNPLAAAVARAALRVIVDEDLATRSEELGEYAMEYLRELKSPLIRSVRGKGLWLGVELTVEARPVCERLMGRGVLCKETHHTVIRLAQPLVISKGDLLHGLEQVKAVLEEMAAEAETVSPAEAALVEASAR